MQKRGDTRLIHILAVAPCKAYSSLFDALNMPEPAILQMEPQILQYLLFETGAESQDHYFAAFFAGAFFSAGFLTAGFAGFSGSFMPGTSITGSLAAR